MTEHCTLIVGAGQAGSELCNALRQQHYEGRIVLIGDETHLPYRRPPLSKTFLAGEATLDSLLIRKAAVYESLRVECRMATSVTSIDRAQRCVALSDGSRLPYDKLVLATGGTPRRLSLPGSKKPNVHVIRNIGDVETLRADFQTTCHLLVVGGGYIGLEATAVAIKAGLRVTVIEAQPRVLARVAAPEISAFYEGAHRRRGVDVRVGVSLESLMGETRVQNVTLSDGSQLDVDLLIVGIGLIPHATLAEGAGLKIDNGIVVDAYAQTSDADILAIGDCANHLNQHLGRSIRIESVPSAMEQARTAALTICGKLAPHAAMPWFWSEQYDLKLQMAGISQGYDQLVLRGEMGNESFAAFYLRDGVVISADTVNRPLEFAVAKRFVAQRMRIDPAQLSDEAVPLKSLLPAGF